MIFRALFLGTTQLLSCDSLNVEVILCFPQQFAVVVTTSLSFTKVEAWLSAWCVRIVPGSISFSAFLFCLCPNFLTSLIVTLLLFLLGPCFNVVPWDFNSRDDCDDREVSGNLERRFLLLPFHERWNAMSCRHIWRSIGLLGCEGKIQPKAFIGLYVRKEDREIGTAWEGLVRIMSVNSKPQIPLQLCDN